MLYFQQTTLAHAYTSMMQVSYIDSYIGSLQQNMAFPTALLPKYLGHFDMGQIVN
jgi:hypothetical protein